MGKDNEELKGLEASDCALLLAVVSAIPREVRSQLADSIEDIGQAMGLIREAIADCEHGNVEGGKMCGSDALEIVSGLECKFSEIAARLARWSDGGDGDDAGDCACGSPLELVRPGRNQFSS